jgi:AcrR family transcriptional regulator
LPRVIPEYKERAKKRIVEEALKTFSENGYHETKMTDIATRIGVSKGAIYQYFKSKEDLFLAAVEHRISLRQQEMFDFSNNLSSLASEEFFLSNYARLTDSPRFSFDFLSEIRGNDALREKFHHSNLKTLENIIQFFNENKEKGIIKEKVDSTTLIYIFMALRDGFSLGTFYGLELSNAANAWSEIWRIILKEILVDPE